MPGSDPFSSVLGTGRGAGASTQLKAVRSPYSDPFFWTIRVTENTLEIWMPPANACEYDLREDPRDPEYKGLGKRLFCWPLEQSIRALADDGKDLDDAFPGLFAKTPAGSWQFTTGFDGPCYTQMVHFACQVLKERKLRRKQLRARSEPEATDSC